MSLPQFGVKYPVTTTMIFTAMIVLGLFSLTLLGLDLMPKIEIPVISVMTSYEGAGPEEVESKITKVLENRLATIENLDNIESKSEEGISTITLKFDWGINLDEASNDVRDMVDLSEKYLPEDVERPIIYKFNLSMIPILVLAVTAEESYPALYDLIEDRITDPLKTVPGVAAATISGGLERQISVELDRARLEAHHISPDQIINALRKENLDLPGGYIKTGQKEYLIRTPEEIEVDEIGKIVVAATKSGAPIHIKNVAAVKDAFKEETRIVEVNKHPGLIIIVQKQSGANTVQVVKRALKKIDELKKTLPNDVNVVVARDFSEFIESSLANLKDALIWGGFLVVLVLLLFLHSIEAGLIVACSIPTSLIVAFLFLHLGGYTLNLISVSSLAIAMGMVVDAAIVVLDNVYRHREKGESPKEAAVSGTGEVEMAITASTLTTIAIFVPIVFVGGVTGIMFKEMAYVISITLLASLFTALTLIPMLCAKFLNMGKVGIEKNIFIRNILRWSEKQFKNLEDFYSDSLDWALSNRKKTLVWGTLLFIFSLMLFPLVGTRFMPEADANMLRGYVELPVGTRLEETTRVMRDIEDVITKEVPEKTVMFVRWGYDVGGMGRAMGGDEGSNSGTFGVRLISKEKRKRSVNEIVDRLRELLTNKYAGTNIRFSTEDPMAGMLYSEGKPFVIEVYGYDLDEGMRLARDIESELKKVKGIVDIEISRKMGKPELQVRIDRDKASHLGLNVADVGNTIQVFFSGKAATKYREKGKEYDIFVQFQESDRQNISDLENSVVTLPSGKEIRLSNVAAIVEKRGPLKIERKDQERLIRITANLSGKDLGSAVTEAKSLLAKIRIPKGFFVNFGGEREEQKKAFGLLGIALLLGLVLVYMVMAAQFESFRDPFIILFSIPFALVGVIFAHLVFRLVFTIHSFIGIIMLVGIVVNNAIVLISYINILRSRGHDIRSAVTKGGKDRLRAIFMTTITTILGLVPLVFSKGEGSEEWMPLAVTVIGGLTVSTIITLIFVPALYSIFEERKRNSESLT